MRSKQDDLAGAVEKELEALRAKSRLPSISGTWQEGAAENRIKVTIVQKAERFTTECVYNLPDHGEIRWSMVGAVTKEGVIKGRLIHTKAPKGFEDQVRTAKLSAKGDEITGKAEFASGSHEFVWKRLDNAQPADPKKK